MHLSPAILGKTIVEKLEARQTAAVLVIGSDRYTRGQLSKIGCFNFAAAARLSALLTHELKVKSTRDLFHHYGPQHLAVPGLGAICLATLGAAFEVEHLGTLQDYIARHHQKGDHLVTFTTLKLNVLDQQAEANERRRARRKARARARIAHEHRVDRHLTRHAATH